MTSWIHRKPEAANVRGVCVVCKSGLQKPRDGKGTYLPRCTACYRKPYARYNKEVCERCAFIPEKMTQLEVHHIDGNHHNNDPNNLRTLCANCHRLMH